MAENSITILGGGNTAFSVAARLTLQGHKITLYEIPSFKETLAPIKDEGAIHLLGVAGEGKAKLHHFTSDIEEALAGANLILLIVPAYAHKPFAEVCIPHLKSGQTLVIMPGTLGTLEWAQMLREAGKEGLVTLAEVDTAPYVCRKTAPDTATIWGIVASLGLGVLPSTETDRVKAMLDPFFPGIQCYPDVMACGLAAMNPVVHPAGVLMNAGRVEYSRGEFYFYEEGVSVSVAKVIMEVDRERLKIGQALGYELSPVDEAFHAAGFGPKGDLWSTINGSWMLTRLKAPGSLESRWLTEDVPYGLAAWSTVGSQFKVETPTMQAVVNIGSIVMGFDAWKNGRGVKELGIEGLGQKELSTYLKSGLR